MQFREVAEAAWQHSVVAQERGGFWTWALQMSVDYDAEWHADVLNGGFSVLHVWGDFSGGELEVQGVGVIAVRGLHLLFDGTALHRVRPFALAPGGHRFSVVEFRFRDDCPVNERLPELPGGGVQSTPAGGCPMRRGVFRTLLLNHTSSVVVGDAAAWRLKRVASTTIRPEVLVEARRTHAAVRYVLPEFWQRVVRECAFASPHTVRPAVRLTAAQVADAVSKGLCEPVSRADLPPPHEAFSENVGLWLVADKDPELGRLIVHPRALNDAAPSPDQFFFPSPFQIVRNTLSGPPRPARVVDARGYYWQFRAPPALRDALRFSHEGTLYRWLRLPMGLRHAVAAGQAFFLWLVGLPEVVDWAVPRDVLVYIDGGMFLGKGSDTVFVARSRRGPVELGEDGDWTFYPMFTGMAFDILRGVWRLKPTFRAKAVQDPEVPTARAALGVLGRTLAALRYLALPLALCPSAYRYASDLLEPGVGDVLDRTIVWPAGVVDEILRVRELVGVERRWRPLPESYVAVASDATLTGWGVVFLVAHRAVMFAARWPYVQSSQPMCEAAAMINAMIIAVSMFRGTYLERWGDCVPALSWARRGLAKTPLVNSWFARATMSCEMAGIALGTRWVSTLMMPADAPSREGLPDERTLAWRPVALPPQEMLAGPEWPLGLPTFADRAAAAQVLRRVMPGWEPPGEEALGGPTPAMGFPLVRKITDAGHQI